MRSCKKHGGLALLLATGLLGLSTAASADPLSIDRAEWRSGDRELRVEGKGTDNRTVTIKNAGSGATIGSDTVDDDEWSRRIRNLTQVPCTVSVQESGSSIVVTRNVSNRPANCGPVVGTPALPTLSINDVAVTEGGTATFTVSLSARPTSQVTVNVATANGSTQGASDFTARTATVTFAANTTTLTQNFEIATVNDTVAESTEAFNVNLSGATNATIADAQAIGTITDNDNAPPAVSLRINDVSVNEGQNATFVVTLSAASTVPVTVVASTANGTAAAPGDFTAQTNVTLTFPAGTTTQNFAVATLADSAAENSETFTVNLSGAVNATIADNQGVGTITNVAPPQTPPTISINDTSANEGQNASFTVSLSAASNQTVTVLASTGGGTATAGTDYTARSNVTITFPAGSTSQAFTVTTLTDAVTDNNETFNVNLSGAVNATIADAQGVGTIGNVAPPPAGASLSVNDITVTEGNTATFTISLSAATTAQVTVNFSTSNGTATGTDFTAVTSRLLTIAAGQTSVTTQVVTTQDTTAETTETFNVTLNNASGATIADGAGVGTIVDNDFTNAAQAHATMTTYDGPQTCVACHETQARQMHGSVHYQQNGPTEFTVNGVTTDTVTNITGLAGEGPAGKPSGVNAVIGINTYCGTHENSPRFTCAGCHVGNGRFPKTPAEFTALGAGSQAQLQELANIDCLTCHQEQYKRFPDWTASGYGFQDLVLANVQLDASGNLVAAPGQSVRRTGLAGIPNVDTITFDFMFRPLGAAGSVIPPPVGVPQPLMPITTEQAAQRVHATTRQSCLNCHAGAAGANGAKRGDLSTSNIASADLNLDRHMATTGSNLTCSSCHNVNDAAGNSLHRVRGRGLDLRAIDQPARFTCDNSGCHNAATVHSAVTNGTQIARHMTKVACQTCHIPTYGKGVATEIARDWQNPHVTQTACNGRGGWLPNEIKSSTATPPVGVVPSYQWFDGTSQVYYLTETLTNTPRKTLPANIATAFGMPTTTQAYVMGRPNPNPENATTRVTGAGNNAAKIYPMKEHWGKLARNVSVNAPGVPLNSLIPQSTFEFFRTGSFCRSVAEGLGQNPDTACLPGQDKGVPAGTEVVAVHTYQTINHGVEPQARALGANNSCGSCHDVAISPFTTGKPLRMFLERDMGYAVTRTGISAPTANGTVTCSNIGCHSTQTGNFTNIHSRSNHRNAGCNACHGQITGR